MTLKCGVCWCINCGHWRKCLFLMIIGLVRGFGDACHKYTLSMLEQRPRLKHNITPMWAEFVDVLGLGRGSS